MRNESGQQQHCNKQGTAENRDSETDTRRDRIGIEMGLFKHGALLSLQAGSAIGLSATGAYGQSLGRDV
ncbi:hypothetical protein BEL01nite_60640 [Bradyrhizobium elkanii]|nr:hypothetical protein BEL01nite_60640 [Bradyrhizobium elkanii]